jgi:hypothetical protein
LPASFDAPLPAVRAPRDELVAELVLALPDAWSCAQVDSNTPG